MIHRTNIEKFWVTDTYPDNMTVEFDSKKFNRERQSIHEELTNTYGPWQVGEPMTTKWKNPQELTEQGIVGVYSRSKTGEMLSAIQVQNIIHRALREPPPKDVLTRANELLNGLE